jgi:galactokinase
LIPERLLEVAPSDADLAVRAPGRANLIGEHTDYNDGFVLPVALEMATFIVGRRRRGALRLISLQEPGEVVVDLDTAQGPQEGWGRYVTAVVRALKEASVGLHGLDGALHSDVPTGAGLSSSAALEVAVAVALVAERGGRVPIDSVRLAEICRRAENAYVGVDVGIMDQLASAAGRAGHALRIDCRSNAVEAVPVPAEVAILLVDSGLRRDLGDSAYNERRAQCRAAADALGLSSLRDATPEALADAHLDDVRLRRARHVVTENQRVLTSVAALRAGDLDAVGRMLYASHSSLATDFEVSTPELDALVAIASDTKGVFGARLTGAGFGGCTVNLVARDHAHEAGAAILERYEARRAVRGRYWVSRPAAGAGVLGC